MELIIHKEGSSDPVKLMSVRVTEDYSGIVWEIETFDPSDLYELREGKRVLKPFDDFPVINAVPISRMTFGKVPEGFRQFFPSDGQIPTLREGHEYEVFVTAGAHRGRTKFVYNLNVKP